MDKKVCMITGANRSIGKATALGLAKMGLTVVMVCRNRELGEAAGEEIKAESGNTAVAPDSQPERDATEFHRPEPRETLHYPSRLLPDNATVYCFSHGNCWKNFSGGKPVNLRIQGEDYTGTATPTITDKQVIAETGGCDAQKGSTRCPILRCFFG